MSLRRSARVALLAGAGLALSGCLPTLAVVPLRSASSKPSNVAVYFTVDTQEGKPVANLTADQFTIYEDGSKVSAFESKQTILNPKVGSAHYTLLLIDMSGSIVGAKQVGDVIKAASAFTERVRASQTVAVYAFDGGPELYPIVPFTTSESAATGGVERLTTFKPKDPSTNLNGAVVEGMKLLRKALAADTKSIKLGTLVVFTDGSDRANRVSPADLHAALGASENAKLDLFAVGVGAELDGAALRAIGRSGTVIESDPANMTRAFDAAAAKIEAAAARYYLLSYCTPSRAGFHDVRIEAHSPDGQTGALVYHFNADGFEADLAHPPEPPPEKKEPPKKAARKPRAAAPSSGSTPSPAPTPAPASDPFAP